MSNEDLIEKATDALMDETVKALSHSQLCPCWTQRELVKRDEGGWDNRPGPARDCDCWVRAEQEAKARVVLRVAGVAL